LAVSTETETIEKGNLTAFQHSDYELKLPSKISEGSWLFIVVENDEGDPT